MCPPLAPTASFVLFYNLIVLLYLSLQLLCCHGGTVLFKSMTEHLCWRQNLGVLRHVPSIGSYSQFCFILQPHRVAVPSPPTFGPWRNSFVQIHGRTFLLKAKFGTTPQKQPKNRTLYAVSMIPSASFSDNSPATVFSLGFTLFLHLAPCVQSVPLWFMRWILCLCYRARASLIAAWSLSRCFLLAVRDKVLLSQCDLILTTLWTTRAAFLPAHLLVCMCSQCHLYLSPTSPLPITLTINRLYPTGLFVFRSCNRFLGHQNFSRVCTTYLLHHFRASPGRLRLLRQLNRARERMLLGTAPAGGKMDSEFYETVTFCGLCCTRNRGYAGMTVSLLPGLRFLVTKKYPCNFHCKSSGFRVFLKVGLGIWEFCAISCRLISKIRFPHPISVADAICRTRFDLRDSKRRALEN